MSNIITNICSGKSEKRPITSTSTSNANSVNASKKNSAIPKNSNYRPGQPGFSGLKLKINNRCKNLMVHNRNVPFLFFFMSQATKLTMFFGPPKKYQPKTKQPTLVA